MIRQSIIFWIKPIGEPKVYIKYNVDHHKHLTKYEADEMVEKLMEKTLFETFPYNENFQVHNIKKTSGKLGWRFIKKTTIKSKLKSQSQSANTQSPDQKEFQRKFQKSGLIDREGNVYYCVFAEHHKLIKELHQEGKINTPYTNEENFISSDQIYELYSWIDDNGWIKFSAGSFHFGNGNNGLHKYYEYEYVLTENQIKSIVYLLVSYEDNNITINGEQLLIVDFLKKIDVNKYSIINDPSERLDKNKIGNKAYNLCLMKKNGLNIPNFIIIPNETCIKILKENEIKNHFFNDINLPDAIFYSVRSSAPISMPGMLDTYLFVKKEELVEKILLVIKSWKNKRAKDYRKIMNIHDSCQISVIIQKMINSTKDENSGSGVFICKNNKMIKGEFLHKQTGLNLVNGSINPLDISEIQFNIKKKIKEQIKKICEIKKEAQEVEFSYESGEVFILQTRDYIDNIEHKEIINVNDFQLIGFGKRGNEGISIGKAVFDESDIKNIEGDKIYVAFHTSVEEVNNMSKCKGVISSIGGALSHAAITARHLNIPCVAGSKFKIINKIAFFENCEIRVGDMICVDGNNGNIFKI